MVDRYIHFVIAGAQRCGTTYLYNLLDSHPEVLMAKPVKPEPKFFLDDQEFHKGREYYLDKYFRDRIGRRALGEKSTSYIEYPMVAKRVHDYFPAGKALIVLRNPVDRAISNYFFSKNNDLETRTLKEVFIEKVKEPVLMRELSVSPFSYLERGKYRNYLEPFRKAFNERLKLIVLEELLNNHESTRDIFRFLGVDLSFTPTMNVSRNESLQEHIDESELAEVRKYLRQYYREDILHLEKFMGIDLFYWRQDEK